MLIFIEGVSGVGKSTMVKNLSKSLCKQGYNVKSYLEGDITNPIDFYCTAYFTLSEYEDFCVEHISYIDKIKSYTICIDDIRLVRYYDNKTPLFCEDLISEFKNRELNYKTNSPLPFDEYLKLLKKIWKRFADNIDKSIDYFIFDGTLLHHTINDLIRNYNADSKQIAEFVNSLLASLGNVSRKIFYLKTDDIPKCLTRARANRKQTPPTQNKIDFWINRYDTEIKVIPHIDEDCKIFDISDNKWSKVKEDIINTVLDTKLISI